MEVEYDGKVYNLIIHVTTGLHKKKKKKLYAYLLTAYHAKLISI